MHGRVERFRDEVVLEVDAIARAEDVDPAAFLPSTYRDVDELDGFLEHLAGEVYDRGYRSLLDALLGDGELRAAWRRAPCTRGAHHAYLGGLLEHTVAVATLAHEVSAQHPRLNSDLLLTAAIVHDLGRTREFTYGAEIGVTEEGRLLGHMVLGERLLSGFVRRSDVALDAERELALLHCVLSHHGPSSAPGGRFASAEALALFRLNALDTSVKGALEVGLDGGAACGVRPGARGRRLGSARRVASAGSAAFALGGRGVRAGRVRAAFALGGRAAFALGVVRRSRWAVVLRAQEFRQTPHAA